MFFIFHLSAILKGNNCHFEETIRDLKPIYKEELLKCAVTWNVNSKNCQVAQVSSQIIEYVIPSNKKFDYNFTCFYNVHD